MKTPLTRVHEFAGFVRANGIAVDPSALLDACAALEHVGTASRTGTHAALRACLCRRHEDWQRFDRLFHAFFRPRGEASDFAGVAGGQGSPGGEDGQTNVQVTTLVDEQRLLGFAGTSEKQRLEEEFFGAGDFKALSLADFRFMFDPAQRVLIGRLVEAMARRARRRVTRRTRSAERGGRFDLRRSLRRSLSYDGRLVELRFRTPARRLDRLVLLIDISQSMDVYARLFLRFVRILMTVFQRSDAFAFDTDLVPLGRGGAKLREEDFERVLNRAGKGWLGGTRIAASIERFTSHDGSRMLDPRTTVVIFSDGCDTAKPERLAAAVEALRRRCGRLVWVNPLLGRFAPGQPDRFMDPVVPHLDRYLPAHCLESLAALERELLERR